jgi:hypothetical protein
LKEMREVPTCVDAHGYPCGVGIPAIELRVRTTSEGATSERTVRLTVPMGC